MQTQSIKEQFGKDRTIRNFQACAEKLGFEKVGQFQLETKYPWDTSENKNEVFAYARRDGAILTFNTAFGGTYLNSLQLTFELIPTDDLSKVWDYNVNGGYRKTADGSPIFQGNFATTTTDKSETWLEERVKALSTLGKVQKFSQPFFDSKHCFTVEQDYSNQQRLCPGADHNIIGERVEQVQAQRLASMPDWVKELMAAGNPKPTKPAEPQPPQVS